MSKNTICLWYDKDAETAARFYAATFPDSAVGAMHYAPSDYPGGKEGDVLTVEFTILGKHKFDCRPFVEISITLGRRVFQRNDLRVDDVGDGQTVVPNGLHELTIVTQREWCEK